VTTLTHPSSTGTAAYHIAANGKVRVVGTYYPNSGGVMGFLYEGGKYTDIPGPQGSLGSLAQGINDNGDIVGQFDDTKGTHGFLLSKGKYTTLDVPGNFGGTIATGINDKGFIVVYWGDTKSSIESSIYNPKTKKFKKVNVPGGTLTAAWDIDNAGDVVYEWIGDAVHAALLHGGHYYKFDYPKGFGTRAVGINDRGMLVGAYQETSGGPFLGFKASY
jgi:probable HAF family extracellular repeat protein